MSEAEDVVSFVALDSLQVVAFRILEVDFDAEKEFSNKVLS